MFFGPQKVNSDYSRKNVITGTTVITREARILL